MARPVAVLAVICLLPGAVVAGCGGGSGDKQDAEATVKQFVKAVDAQDSKRFCNDLVSDSFLEGAFGTKGSAGKKQCETQVKALKNVNLHLVDIKKTEVKGKKANVTVELDSGGRKQTQVLPLVKQGNAWRVSTIAPGGGP
jgi:hypothetical protein